MHANASDFPERNLTQRVAGFVQGKGQACKEPPKRNGIYICNGCHAGQIIMPDYFVEYYFYDHLASLGILCE